MLNFEPRPGFQFLSEGHDFKNLESSLYNYTNYNLAFE